MPAFWRRVRQRFGISAPRMAVRTHVPWWGRGAIVVSLLAIIGGMWWWGFDFGQILGGFNRQEVETRLASLETEAAKYRNEAADLRARNATLESELAMTRGKQDALTKQATDLTGENAQIKEELAFLQKLVADSSKLTGVSVQRLSAESERDDAWHYSLLLVRGGNPRDEFQGQVTLQATLGVVTTDGTAPRFVTVTLPDDQPESAATLALRFKYYQRLEGTMKVPPGARLVSLTAKVFETGVAMPRATRTLTNP